MGFNKKKKAAEPRHHYEVSHYALRETFEIDPLGLFKLLSSEHCDIFMKELWKEVCRNSDDSGEPPFHMRDVKLSHHVLKTFPAILITMPPPRCTREGWYALMVIKVDIFSQTPPEGMPELKYITLDRLDDNDGDTHSALCLFHGDKIEVLEQGPHDDKGPIINEKVFLDAAAKFI